ncbi:FlgB family protein [Amaricoccus macauensis]|uniref:FlgB family protein n=1 Tax=Amaricoccus macauensis TaxID=57001 RepID=UPI003C7D4103
MDMNLNVLRLASGLATHSAARQQVIAENIAHADTPGYRARDIASFEETLNNSVPHFEAKTTRPGHIAFGADNPNYRPFELTAFGAESPNGNTVSLEDQMMRSTDVREHHKLALGVYQKSMEIMRTSLGR